MSHSWVLLQAECCHCSRGWRGSRRPVESVEPRVRPSLDRAAKETVHYPVKSHDCRDFRVDGFRKSRSNTISRGRSESGLVGPQRRVRLHHCWRRPRRRRNRRRASVAIVTVLTALNRVVALGSVELSVPCKRIGIGCKRGYLHGWRPVTGS